MIYWFSGNRKTKSNIFGQVEDSWFSRRHAHINNNCIFISGLIVFLIAKGLKISLDGEPKEVADLLSKVAKGDLTQEIKA